MTLRLPYPLFILWLLSLALGCAPARPPVPVGTVPPASKVTPAEEQHGQQVLKTLQQQYKLDYNHPRYQSVLDVVEKLTTSINARGEPWHVYVFNDASFKNAAATRGNHIFIWTGMIDATKNDDELAAVLGHEIGHVLARHTDPDPNENIRRAIIELGALAAGVAVAAATENPSLGQNAGRITASLSKEVGNAIAVYPHSREREYEADHIGLFLMYRAGYRPQAAVDFWKRAVSDPSFSSNLAFFSTHPPAGDRLARLEEILPQLQPNFRPKASANQRRRGGSTTPPAAASDSFDVSEIIAQDKQFSQWQVLEPRAVVFSRADERSKRLGEFRQGSKILGVEHDAEWIRIESPDPGFVRRLAVTRTTR